MTHQHQHAVVMRLAVGCGMEHLQQFKIVSLIGLRLAGVARGKHSGPAVQNIHANSRIVGERRQPATSAGMARLAERIFHEIRVRLVRLGNIKSRLRHNFDTERGKQLSNLAQLAGVVAGNYKFFHVLVHR